jgi:beta-lactam-binding protein with PASTA domain
VTTIQRCPECGEPATPGADFCANPSCRHYLAWDRPDDPVDHTDHTDHTDPAEAAAGTPTAATADGHDVELQQRPAAIRLLEVDELSPVLTVAAGESVTVTARVRNQSRIVDRYDVSVEFVDGHDRPLARQHDDWWAVDPPEGLPLLPFGTGGQPDWEKDAKITLRPPRSSEAKAGYWRLRIVVDSDEMKREVTSITLVLKILPFTEVATEVTPEVATGRRRGEFTFTVNNDGNAPIDLKLAGNDREQACLVDLHPGELQLAAGANASVAVKVAPVKPQLTGRATEHQVTLIAVPRGTTLPDTRPRTLRQQLVDMVKTRAAKEAKAAQKQGEKALAPATDVSKKLGVGGAPAPAAEEQATAAPAEAPDEDKGAKWSTRCTYRQRPWIPFWVLIVAVLAVVAYVVWQKLQPGLHKVPNVTGEWVLSAKAELTKKGFDRDVKLVVPPAWRAKEGLKACGKHKHLPGGVPPPGHVFATRPGAGKKRPSGWNVTLDTAVLPVARGETIRVPDITGLPTVAAEEALSCMGFALVKVRQSDPPVKDPVVVDQTPNAATEAVPVDTPVVVTLGQETPVPNLIGLKPITAHQKLLSLGLVLGRISPISCNEPPKQSPGCAPKQATLIASQSVPPNQSLIVGRTIDVGLGGRVPKLAGLSLMQANARLQAAGGLFTVAKLTTPRAVPPNFRIVRQNPRAKSVARFGTKIRLTFAAPKPKHKKAAKKAKAKKAASGAAAVAVPAAAAAAGASPATAAAALGKAKVKTKTVLQISAKIKKGKLITTIPAPGSKVKPGATVTLVVSAGYPEVAVDNGHDVLALNGVTGKVAATIAGGPNGATQPSWSPSGTEIAYISRGRVYITSATAPSGPRALTPGGRTLALPTFPTATTAPAVLATIEPNSNGKDDLCLLDVAHPKLSCLATGLKLGNEISWSPHGSVLLVGATRPSGEFGLLELTTHKHFSTRASDWSSKGIVTPTASGTGVRAGAFSPNAKRLALAQNFGGTPFSLALTAPSDLTLSKEKVFAAPTPACSVAWRTDSLQVLVQASPASDCAHKPGSLYRVDPAHPDMLSLLATGVQDPSWQPLPGIQ